MRFLAPAPRVSWAPEMGAERIGTMPRDSCCPEQTTAAVEQAAFCLEWTQAAATPTANPVQNEQELLL
eukprot:3018078-Pyramimonas_sp.AAC.1